MEKLDCISSLIQALWLVSLVRLTARNGYSIQTPKTYDKYFFKTLNVTNLFFFQNHWIMKIECKNCSRKKSRLSNPNSNSIFEIDVIIVLLRPQSKASNLKKLKFNKHQSYLNAISLSKW